MPLSLSHIFSTSSITATLTAGLILIGSWTITAQAPPDSVGGKAAKGGSSSAADRFVVIGDPLSIYGDKLVLIERPDPLDKITPVTEPMIANPSPGEWLTWRRGYDGTGFSPLKQITKANVGELQLVWSWSLTNGPNESTPLVHDGVIFCYGYGDKVQALDAATGDLLWEYARRSQGRQVGLKRAIAIYGDKLYLATSDSHMVALDIKTGQVGWDQEIAEKGSPMGEAPTGGPLVAKGKVMIGTIGRSAHGGSQIVAFDAQTGSVAWRFHTLAQPGDPGDNTWNGVPVEKRTGGSVWVPGTYDPALGLAYFGIAQTYDTGPFASISPVSPRVSAMMRCTRIQQWRLIPTTAKSPGISNICPTTNGTSIGSSSTS
jgi:outer membrane protein assembly factor BamB